MNNPDAAGPWCCYNDNAGEGTAVPTTGESGSFFADMVADYSTDDLFELVREQEGQAGGAPAVSSLWSQRFSSKPSDVRFDFDPPSEDEMAAWLGAIVKGQELASCNDGDGGGRRRMADDGHRDDVEPPAMGTSSTVKGDTLASCNDDDGPRRPMADDDGRHDVVPLRMGTSSTVTDKKEKVRTTTTEGMKMGNNKEIRMATAGGSSRRSHHGEAHNLTEKRRRHKINERLKTLQQLVPGCSKSNQASTLDQTIHYMKSLQHQVQAMSVGIAAPAVYPVVQLQCVPPGMSVTMPFPAAAPMVPFGTTMLQLPHYPAAAVVMPLYPAAAPASTGDAMSANQRFRGSSSADRKSSKGKGKGSSSMYQSDRT